MKCFDLTAIGELRNNDEMCDKCGDNTSESLAQAYWTNYVMEYYIMGDQGEMEHQDFTEDDCQGWWPQT